MVTIQLFCKKCESDNLKYLRDTLVECLDCHTIQDIQEAKAQPIKEKTTYKATSGEIDINNANHPSRQKAIRIMEYISDYIGSPRIFDCKDGDTTWYDVEDNLTNIIEGKE